MAFGSESLSLILVAEDSKHKKTIQGPSFQLTCWHLHTLVADIARHEITFSAVLTGQLKGLFEYIL